MEKISFEVYASDVTIKPDNYSKIRVEIDGVEIPDLLESIGDDGSILKAIGEEGIAVWVNDNDRVDEFLEYLDPQEVSEWLESKGWKMQEQE